MQATFVELPRFERVRRNYLDDEAYRLLQQELMQNPEAGEVIEGTGGAAQTSAARPQARQREARRPASYLLLVDRWGSVLAVHGLRQG